MAIWQIWLKVLLCLIELSLDKFHSWYVSKIWTRLLSILLRNSVIFFFAAAHNLHYALKHCVEFVEKSFILRVKDGLTILLRFLLFLWRCCVCSHRGEIVVGSERGDLSIFPLLFDRAEIDGLKLVLIFAWMYHQKIVRFHVSVEEPYLIIKQIHEFNHELESWNNNFGRNFCRFLFFLKKIHILLQRDLPWWILELLLASIKFFKQHCCIRQLSQSFLIISKFSKNLSEALDFFIEISFRKW